MDAVFVHGWGYDSTIWDRLINRLGGLRAHTIDLGYFGAESQTAFPEDAVAIGHSYGVMHLLAQRPARFRALVSIAGFDCFTAHIPPRTVAAMQAGLERDTDSQLRRFWTAAGTPDWAPSGPARPEPLKSGLRHLMEGDERSALQALTCPVLALAGDADTIVPAAMSEAIWKGRELHWRESGSHALPWTDTEWCAQHIEGFLHDLS